MSDRSSKSDTPAYLQDDFDPKKATMANIRNILNEHNVDYSAAKKKDEYISLFSEHISPRIPELRKRYQSVTPFSGGIEDATVRRSTRNSSRSNTPDPSSHKVSKSSKKTSSKKGKRSTVSSPQPDDVSISSIASNAEDSEGESSRLTSTKRRTRKLNKPAVDLDESTTRISAKSKKDPSPLKGLSTKRITRHLHSVADGEDDSFNSDTSTKRSRRTRVKTLSVEDSMDDSESDAPNTSSVSVSTSRSKKVSLETAKRHSKAKKSTEVKSDKVDILDEVEKSSESESSDEDDNIVVTQTSTTVEEDGNVVSKTIDTSVSTAKDGVISERDEYSRNDSISVTPLKSSTPKLATSVRSTPGTASRSSFKSHSAVPVKSPLAERSSTSPFSSKNFFQSSAKNSPFSRKRKASEEEEEEDKKEPDVSSKKKKTFSDRTDDLSPSKKSPEKQTSTPDRSIQRTPSHSRIPNKDNHLTPDTRNRFNSGSLITPENRPPNLAPPPTAPPLRSSGYSDASFPAPSPTMPYSTRKQLSGVEKGRRISFLTNTENLKISEKLSEKLSESVKSSVPESKVESESNNSVVNPINQSDSEKDVNAVEDADESVQLQELREEVEEEPEIEVEEYDEPENESGVSSSFLKVILLFTLVSSLGAFSKWYTVAKFDAGYCDVGFEPPSPISGRHLRSLFSSPAPETWQGYFEKDYLLEKLDEAKYRWDEVVDHIRPECEPCPENAVCLKNFELICDDGFIKINSPLSLGGIFPVSPRCVLDTGKQKRVKRMAEKALQLIQDRKANYVCGYEGCNSEEFEEAELRRVLYSMKADTLSDEEFDELWQHAIADVEDNEDVIVREVDTTDKQTGSLSDDEHESDTNGLHDRRTGTSQVFGDGIVRRKAKEASTTSTAKFFTTSTLSRLPLGCAIRRSISGFVARYRAYAGFLLTLVLLAYGGVQYKEYRDKKIAHAETLARQVVEKLKDQLRLSREDERGRTLTCVAAGHLRDELQKDVLDLKTRKKVWDDVQTIIESNTNIRSKQTDIRGEIMRVWEWVGPESQ